MDNEQFIAECEKKLQDKFSLAEDIAYFNQKKVLKAFADNRISLRHFNGTTGYGKADKIQMQHVVTSILHLNKIPRPDDAADALAVALCHAHTSRFGKLFGIK